MFITATAPNPLIVKLIADATGAKISISWGMWALAMLLPGLVALCLMPLVLYWLYPPQIRSTPNAAQFARSKLAERGPLNRGEKIMLCVFVMLLLLWAGVPATIFGNSWVVDPTTTAFLCLGVPLLLAYLYAHYLFASTTAHVTAMFAAFYGAGIALGAPALPFALLMAAASNIMSLCPAPVRT